MSWRFRALRPADLDAAHRLRQQALRDAPAAFGSAPEDAHETRAAWAEVLAGGHVYGGFDADERLLAMAGLALSRRRKTRHKARMWGVFVDGGARGGGLGRALVEHVIAVARESAEWLDADVGADNAAALALYESLGFERYGTEPAALRVDGRDVAVHRLTRRL